MNFRSFLLKLLFFLVACLILNILSIEFRISKTAQNLLKSASTGYIVLACFVLCTCAVVFFVQLIQELLHLRTQNHKIDRIQTALLKKVSRLKSEYQLRDRLDSKKANSELLSDLLNGQTDRLRNTALDLYFKVGSQGTLRVGMPYLEDFSTWKDLEHLKYRNLISAQPCCFQPTAATSAESSSTPAVLVQIGYKDGSFFLKLNHKAITRYLNSVYSAPLDQMQTTQVDQAIKRVESNLYFDGYKDSTLEHKTLSQKIDLLRSLLKDLMNQRLKQQMDIANLSLSYFSKINSLNY